MTLSGSFESRNRVHRIWLVNRWLVCLLIMALGGCGANHPPVAKVVGSVLFRGQPLAGGKVLFLPEGGGKQGIGSIQSDGSFELTTFKRGDGALVGWHHVVVLKATSSAEAKVGSFERANKERSLGRTRDDQRVHHRTLCPQAGPLLPK